MPARDTKNMSTLWPARQTCRFGACSPIFTGLGEACGISTEMEGFVDTPTFLLLIFCQVILVLFPSNERTIFVDIMSSRKKLRTRTIACAALYIIFNEEEKKPREKHGWKNGVSKEIATDIGRF